MNLCPDTDTDPMGLLKLTMGACLMNGICEPPQQAWLSGILPSIAQEPFVKGHPMHAELLVATATSRTGPALAGDLAVPTG